MIPKKLVALVLARDNHQCVIAGPMCTRTATICDHRANRGMGGSTVLDAPENLLSSCVLDNGAKEDADGGYRAELLRRGVRVEQASTNALTLARARNRPVEYPDGTLWFLLSNGGREQLTEASF